MVGERRVTRLAAIGSIVVGKTPPTECAEMFGGPVPFVTPGDLDGRRRIARAARTLSERGARAVGAAHVPRGAVLVACIGSDLGKVAVADVDVAHNQQICSLVVRGPDCGEYVYYDLSERTAALRGAAGGSAQPILNKRALGELPIELPPPAAQRRVAAILGALDERVELHRATGETAAAIAGELYRAWFVAFSPVGAPREVQAWFAGARVDSPLGEIPAGWAVARLGELVALDKGLSYRGEHLGDVGRPLIGLGCFAPGGRFLGERVRRYAGAFVARHEAAAGELLVANTDISQRRDVLGAPLLVPDLGGARALYSHHAYALRPTAGGEGWREYLYFALQDERFRARAAGFATGTTVLALPRDALLGHAVVVPPAAVRAAFVRAVGPLLARIEGGQAQADTLAGLRDALRPRLLRGELDGAAARLFPDEVAEETGAAITAAGAAARG
jgi:type I restriction enzyme S subunit